ncbi:general transcription factor IIE subunit 1-like [Cucurbita maxima]|uniref:General transcription factor IIE subunit 1-like n=1 Tax=Cucurbita maxima TaxID=3661 RepID=A0A6J1KW18_CUCMA|nr:general transcription factor IIE subunit 1-like [Cucurbita maxima]
MSIEPFNRLVKLAARAFYDDITTKGDNQPKTGRSDNRGIAVVVLDALTRRQWVREEDLAKNLKLHSKQLRRTLRFLEEEKLITRDHRRETAKGAKIFSAAVAATADGQRPTKEGDEKIKMHTHSYCSLDYAQIYDVVRYRVHRMRKKLKDELEDKNTVQEYICPNCSRRYTALDALRLISLEDEYFHCENCNGELVAESDKLAAAQGGGDGDDNARKRRHEKLKDMLQKMEVQLKPLMEQVSRVKDLAVPEFGTLLAWEAHASAAARANGDLNGNDPSKSSQGLGYGGAPMPFVGETKVEVAFSGADGKGADVKSESETSLKVLPPWMIKKGMNLTKEQRGEVKEESKMDAGSASAQFFDDKKSSVNDDDKTNIQDEYVKAYYAAILKKQQELEEAAKSEQNISSTEVTENNTNSSRQVGMKAKREEEDDDDIEWEEAPTGGNANENYKVDLNVEASASVEDDEEEDDVDWEEG